MGLYNFKAQFVPFILSGRKTHTIRAPRKNVEKVGNMMHLYTGLRQKGAKLLLRSVCVKVENILITPGHVVRIDGNYLEPDECELLAQRDGFRDFKEMMSFWDGRLPFIGHVIHWQSPQKNSVRKIREARLMLREIDPSLEKKRPIQ